jgi:hypothetical protein
MQISRKWMGLEHARSRLLVIWMIGGGLVFLILTIQSILGRYGDKLQAVWSWFIPTVVPTLSLMVGVLGASALTQDLEEKKIVRVFFFQVSQALSVFYLASLFLTIALEPVTKIAATDLYTMSNYWLGPLQGLVLAALGVLFVSREHRDSKPAVDKAPNDTLS